MAAILVSKPAFPALPRPLIVRIAVTALAVFLVAPKVPGQAASPDPFLQWMQAVAKQDLAQRAESVRGIHTIVEEERRERVVRQELLDSVGGLPDYHGPLHARVTGELHTDSYTIEKVLYESLPSFYITANLYRPNESGRYPAVLLQSGHTQEGKSENQRIAANLAMKGFVVLCFDPIGQGEREQTYSRQLDAPLAEWSVPEHIMMDAQSQLIGQGLARYFIWDAMRSLDYLASRPDVDADRIGAAGCSGGGALTTFIGALDSRIKAVVPACYPSSFDAMFAPTPPHGEMTFPHFLASGLDTADFVEMSAPKPWLLEANEHDQFGFSREGVELVYNEARNWYRVYGAQNKIAFMIGPGPHGMPLVNREALYKWMIRWLKNGQGDSHEQPVHMFADAELRVTPTGHVDDEPGSKKLFQLLRDDLHRTEKPGTIADLQKKLNDLGIPTDGSRPETRLLQKSVAQGITRQSLQFESEHGIWLDAVLYLPSSPQRKPAVVVVKGQEDVEGISPSVLALNMAQAGAVVLEMEPRTTRARNTEGEYTGDWLPALQADLIGRNLPSMRAHDILRGVDLLRSLPNVDPDSIRGAARGVAGIPLLLAAATDARMKEIWLDRTPYSLRSALDSSLTIDLWNAVIPGFILHWDLNDLVQMMGTRRVFWTDPTNWVQRVVSLGPPYRYRDVVGDITDEAESQDIRFLHEFLR